MTKITLEIKTCRECPFFEEKRCYTSDSWELAHDWFCKASDNKKIAGYVNWSEEKDVEIPEWCPARTQKAD